MIKINIPVITEHGFNLIIQDIIQMAKDTDASSFTLPSNPADRKKIRDIFYEMAGITQTIKDRREDLKSYVEVLSNDYQMPKKLIPKIAKIVFEHNFDDISEEHSAIELIYEGIMGAGATDSDDESEED
jgi:archaellum component FlaC